MDAIQSCNDGILLDITVLRHSQYEPTLWRHTQYSLIRCFLGVSDSPTFRFFDSLTLRFSDSESGTRHCDVHPILRFFDSLILVTAQDVFIVLGTSICLLTLIILITLIIMITLIILTTCAGDQCSDGAAVWTVMAIVC